MCKNLGEFVYREKQIFEKNRLSRVNVLFHGEIHEAHINIILCKHGPWIDKTLERQHTEHGGFNPIQEEVRSKSPLPWYYCSSCNFS